MTNSVVVESFKLLGYIVFAYFFCLFLQFTTINIHLLTLIIFYNTFSRLMNYNFIRFKIIKII